MSLTNEDYLNLSSSPNALEDVLWEVNHGAISTYALAVNLSQDVLEELAGYAYQMGAIMDNRTIV